MSVIVHSSARVMRPPVTSSTPLRAIVVKRFGVLELPAFIAAQMRSPAYRTSDACTVDHFAAGSVRSPRRMPCAGSAAYQTPPSVVKLLMAMAFVPSYVRLIGIGESPGFGRIDTWLLPVTAN